VPIIKSVGVLHFVPELKGSLTGGMRSKSSSFNAGFLLDGPLGLDLSRASASSTVQSRAANFEIQIVRELGFPRRGDQGRYDAAMPCICKPESG
jgi:hypothetical protein